MGGRGKGNPVSGLRTGGTPLGRRVSDVMMRAVCLLRSQRRTLLPPVYVVQREVMFSQVSVCLSAPARDGGTPGIVQQRG